MSARKAAMRRRRNILVAGGTTLALCLAGGGVAWAATRDDGGGYRTATAEKASVTQTATLTGTVASASRRDLAFQVGGTVATVPVTVGDKVTAGQTLATLDKTDLDSAVSTAEQTLADAKQTLATDLASQTSTASSSSSSPGGSGGTGGTGSSGGSGASTPGGGSGSGGSGSGGGSGQGGGSGSGSSGSDAKLQAAIAAVTAAQEKLLAQLTTASDALADTNAIVASSSTACQPFLAAALDDASSGGDSGDSGDSSTTDGQDARLQSAKTALADCQSAITAALESQQKTTDAQNAVTPLATALDDAVTALQKLLSASSASGSSASGTTASRSSARTSGSITTALAVTPAADVPSGGTSGGSGSTAASAATIVADNAAIDAANAALALAKSRLAFATLTSPIAGTVAAVSLAAGDTVQAGSTTAVVSVIGEDGYVVTSTVGLTAVAQLKVGQPVAVTVSGSAKALSGKVSAIGTVNTATDSSTPSYTVTTAITGTASGLLDGASATAVVTVATTGKVLTVPTSALHRSGSTYTVEVLKSGKPVTTKVSLGALGTDRAQIASGLTAGTEVVLADLSSTATGDSTRTSSSSGLSGLGGGTRTFTTGGDRFSGGFPGGTGGAPSR